MTPTTLPNASDPAIDAYIARLRKRLRDLGEDAISEICGELRAHLRDRVAAEGGDERDRVEAALAALGSPEELAALYLADEMLARAETSRSPLLLVRGLLRWATLSLAGVPVLLGATIGYLIAAVFVAIALLKPVHPHTAGLWASSDAGALHLTLQLGFEPPPASARELLGWWIVPIGLAFGYGLLVATSRLAVSAVRALRGRRRLPGA
jgi:uncharacterized membrane protein